MSPRKPNQTPLTRERIVQVALRIVDTEGLDALSMRRLGAELAVDASTIYYHLPGKSALYDLVIDAVMGEVDLGAPPPEASAHERLMVGVRAFRKALLAHPGALPLLASRPLVTPESLRTVEYMLAVLHDAGLDYPAALAGMNALAFYVIGGTLAAARPPAASGGEYHEEFDPSRVAALAVQRFPHIRAALTARTAGGAGLEEDFTAGAEALVRGLLAGAA